MFVGEEAEDCACRYLQGEGMVILTRNWRCRGGEVDIVARDGCVLVFVEVRSRRGHRYGRPEETLTAAKLRRLWRAAHIYVGCIDPPFAVRFDIVAVSPDGISHIRDAFGEQDVCQDG